MTFQGTQEMPTTCPCNLHQQLVAGIAPPHRSHPSLSNPDTLLLPASTDGLRTQPSRKQPNWTTTTTESACENGQVPLHVFMKQIQVWDNYSFAVNIFNFVYASTQKLQKPNKRGLDLSTATSSLWSYYFNYKYCFSTLTLHPVLSWIPLM